MIPSASSDLIDTSWKMDIRRPIIPFPPTLKLIASANSICAEPWFGRKVNLSPRSYTFIGRDKSPWSLESLLVQLHHFHPEFADSPSSNFGLTVSLFHIPSMLLHGNHPFLRSLDLSCMTAYLFPESRAFLQEQRYSGTLYVDEMNSRWQLRLLALLEWTVRCTCLRWSMI
jgi:hypothetical protein